jgi:NADH dehydrogenase FAD-containing subunit
MTVTPAQLRAKGGLSGQSTREAGRAGTVAIYGGGIAGAVLANRLSRDFDVTLVAPVDFFEVPMAAPRNLVRPSFADDAIVPFSAALPHVTYVRGRLVELQREASIVEDAGRQMRISADVSVLATGSQFANPLMRAAAGAAEERRAFYGRFNKRLEEAQKILIVGGGPIGVEVAGEISEAYPEKSVTLVEGGPRLLRGTSEALAAHVTAVLSARGVSIHTGDHLDGEAPGAEIFAPGGTVRTHGGRAIEYDLALWCIGGRPNTGYMRPHYSTALDEAGRIQVAPTLRVIGEANLFAVGDVNDLPENKMAFHIQKQVQVAEANIRSVLSGRVMDSDLKTYLAKTGDPTMVVTLGSRAGVSHLPPPFGVVRSGWFNRKLKAERMLTPRYRKAIGA